MATSNNNRVTLVSPTAPLPSLPKQCFDDATTPLPKASQAQFQPPLQLEPPPPYWP